MNHVTRLARGAWSFPEFRGVSTLGFLRYSTKALTLVRLALLTRWLAPSDLGGYGLALLFLAVTEVITETGVNVALLKHVDRLPKYIHTAWLVSLVRGVLIAGVLLVIALPSQRFFEVPAFATYMVWCALIALTKGFINPAVVSFQLKLEFGKDTLFRFPIQLLDIFAGLFFSWWWQSALGLFVGIFAGALLEVVTSFLIFPQRPNLKLARWADARALYRETRGIVANGIVNYLNEHADDFLIGKLLGPAALGLYQTGYKLVSALTIDIANIGGQAFYPILSQRQHQPRAFIRTAWISLFGYLALITPLMIIAVLFPEEIIQTLFGVEWLEIAWILPWLLLAAAGKGFLVLAGPITILTGTIRWLLFCNILVVALMLFGIWLTAPTMGLLGAAQAVAAAMLIVQPILWFGVSRAIKKKVRE